MAPATLTTPAVEVWRPIRDLENLYEVSSLARVRSIKGHLLYIGHNNNGYCFVNFKIHGKQIKRTLHRLVAQAFIPNPDNLPEVNHKDENKDNNLPSNLEWCDHKYNMNYGTGNARSGIGHRKPVEQLTMDGQHVAYFAGPFEAQQVLGGKFSRHNIGAAARGEAKSHMGYRWRYVE